MAHLFSKKGGLGAVVDDEAGLGVGAAEESADFRAGRLFFQDRPKCGKRFGRKKGNPVPGQPLFRLIDGVPKAVKNTAKT